MRKDGSNIQGRRGDIAILKESALEDLVDVLKQRNDKDILLYGVALWGGEEGGTGRVARAGRVG